MAISVGDILNFEYTGAVQKISLPPGRYKLEVWGAQGGYRSSKTYGGKGGYSVGTIVLNKEIQEDTELFIYVGGSGNSVSAATSSIYPGGFNGGGYRYKYKGGGGASDIRIGVDSLYARVIVAGGGGSDGAATKKGMYGGGTSGGATTESYGSYGYGGTQTGHTTSVTMPSSQPTTNSSANYPGASDSVDLAYTGPLVTAALVAAVGMADAVRTRTAPVMMIAAVAAVPDLYGPEQMPHLAICLAQSTIWPTHRPSQAMPQCRPYQEAQKPATAETGMQELHVWNFTNLCRMHRQELPQSLHKMRLHYTGARQLVRLVTRYTVTAFYWVRLTEHHI